MSFRYLIIILISLLSNIAFAVPEESAFGLAQSSREWNKKEFEDWLVKKIEVDLGQFVPQELFKVYADVTYKSPKDYVRKVSNVNLSMLGTVATLVEEDKAKPELGLFDRIQKLDITLIVADSVSEQTVKAMATVIAKRVPVLNESHFNTQVVRMEPPAKSVNQWLQDFKGVLGGLFALAMIIFAAFQIGQKMRLRASIQFAPASEPLNERVEASMHAVKQSDEAASEHEKDEDFVPVPQAQSPSHRPAAHHQVSKHSQVHSKKSLVKSQQTVSSMGLNLDQVDPDKEEQFLNILLTKEEYTNFAQMVRQSLPIELLQHAPAGAIKATFAHMSHWDRLEVMAWVPERNQENFWAQMPRPVQEARDLLTEDIERIRRESSHVAQKSQQSSRRFMKTIREAIRKNSDWSKAVRPHIENWIYVKTNGNEGQPYGNKVA